MSQVNIVPVNSIDSTFLLRLALCLEERFLHTFSVERVLRLPRTVLNSDRNQLFLSTLVSRLTSRTPPNGGVMLAVTEFDLYKTSHKFIFGDANENQRVAVISTHRLRGEFYGEPHDESQLFERSLKEGVHNVGHLFGLKHCFNAQCAMFMSNSIFDTDGKYSQLCDICERKIHANR